jgi:hypothetical protein
MALHADFQTLRAERAGPRLRFALPAGTGPARGCDVGAARPVTALAVDPSGRSFGNSVLNHSAARPSIAGYPLWQNIQR